MKTENNTLKYFMLKHFDYDNLKEVGFYKGINRTDYKGQADRVCHFFSLSSVYDYLKIGEGITCHISVVASTIQCPMCTCEQIIPDKNEGRFTFNCIGCKRPLIALLRWDRYDIIEDGGFNEETKAYLRPEEKSFIYNTKI